MSSQAIHKKDERPNSKLDEQLLLYKKHFSTNELPDYLKSNLGKYYTPPLLVNLVRELVLPYVRPDSVVLDLAAGCGAFLDAFPDNASIIRDIDIEAINFLKAVGYPYAMLDNSLLNVSRNKYGLHNHDHLVCIGNPPYNDITSLNKRLGINAKRDINFELDSDIRSNDLGTSFLRAFGKLGADIICVLHPLSYLIKESNYHNRLKNFTKDYRLQEGVIFSSNEFSDTQGTPFPIVAALYIKDFMGMDYEFIKQFKFKILNSDEVFVLSTYETTDGYISKYAPTRHQVKSSDIGLYMHNFRDLNSLKSIGNLSDKYQEGVFLPVQAKELYKYAYLNALRRYFPKDFRWGNLSPLVIRKQLGSDSFLRDACIIDTIVNNQRLDCFKPNSPIVIKLLADYQTKTAPANQPDIYGKFALFCNQETVLWRELEEFLKEYFINLPALMKQRKEQA